MESITLRKFGSVLKERIKGTERVVAMKKMLLLGDASAVEEKINSLKTIDSHYLVHYRDSLTLPNELWVRMKGECEGDRLLWSIVMASRLLLL